LLATFFLGAALALALAGDFFVAIAGLKN